MSDEVANDVTAFVLAGGQSTRMGKDKAFLELGGETLLGRALRTASSVARVVVVVGDPRKFAAFSPAVEDKYPGRGPLGGIQAALLSTSTDLNVIMAVDLPFLEPRFLQSLIERSRESNAVVTVARVGMGFQPLCAVYRREFASVAGQSLQGGNNKIDALFTKVATRVVDEPELTRAGFSSRMFQNLNTPEDLAAAERVLDSSRQTNP